VIKGYGGRCAWCGCSDARFLELDHVAGDGKSERHLSFTRIYRTAIKDCFPARYQLLCVSCNRRKGNRPEPGSVPQVPAPGPADVQRTLFEGKS
jgi:hypothetical protein